MFTLKRVMESFRSIADTLKREHPTDRIGSGKVKLANANSPTHQSRDKQAHPVKHSGNFDLVEFELNSIRQADDEPGLIPLTPY